MNKIIKLDLDGTVRDIVTPTIRVYKEHFDNTCNLTHKDIDKYNFVHKMPKINSLSKELFIPYGREIFANARLYNREIPRMIGTLNCFYQIHIVTNQLNYANEEYTHRWLKENHVFAPDITMTADKNSVKGDILLDDCIDNLVNGVKNGERAICLSQPWNTEWKEEQVDDFQAFYKRMIMEIGK